MAHTFDFVCQRYQVFGDLRPLQDPIICVFTYKVLPCRWASKHSESHWALAVGQSIALKAKLMHEACRTHIYFPHHTSPTPHPSPLKLGQAALAPVSCKTHAFGMQNACWFCTSYISSQNETLCCMPYVHRHISCNISHYQQLQIFTEQSCNHITSPFGVATVWMLP